jgi:hypothetical protein
MRMDGHMSELDMTLIERDKRDDTKPLVFAGLYSVMSQGDRDLFAKINKRLEDKRKQEEWAHTWLAPPIRRTSNRG